MSHTRKKLTLFSRLVIITEYFSMSRLSLTADFQFLFSTYKSYVIFTLEESWAGDGIKPSTIIVIAKNWVRKLVYFLIFIHVIKEAAMGVKLNESTRHTQHCTKPTKSCKHHRNHTGQQRKSKETVCCYPCIGCRSQKPHTYMYKYPVAEIF